MTTGIFIRTYAGDAQWLRYCLASIKKFCTGYHSLTITAPQTDSDLIMQVIAESQVNTVIPTTYVPADAAIDGKDGYLGQQVSKLYADTMVTTDCIAYVDSDCIFHTPNTPDHMFHQARPILYATPYNTIETPWQPITQKALRIHCPYETMRRFPWIIHRAVLQGVRSYMKKLHFVEARRYVMQQPYRSFSEFNAIGSYAIQFMPDQIHMVDTTLTELSPPMLKQYHSWGGITPEIQAEIERTLL